VHAATGAVSPCGEQTVGAINSLNRSGVDDPGLQRSA
jgi:hypothetical protein